MSCIFCKIASKEVSAHRVYEDDRVVGFLDKHPIQPGHTLVIPKEHVSDFYRMEERLYSHLMMLVKELSKVINEKMNPKKVGLAVAGWDVPHTHIHIVPMHNYHDITSKTVLEGRIASPTDEELEKVAAELKKAGRIEK